MLTGDIFAGDGDDVLHLGMRGERGFHLAEFHAEATDLYLMIDPSETFERPIGVPAGEVTCPIDAHPCNLAHRVGQEAVGSQAGSVEVAACESGAADVKLARDPDRDGSEPSVKDVELRLSDRSPDQDRPVARLNLPDTGPDGRLGRPVQVPECFALRQEAIGERPGECFAAAKHRQAVVSLPAGFQQEPPGGGGGLEERHPTLSNPGGKVNAIGGLIARCQFDPGTHNQGEPQLQPGDVERERRHGEQYVARFDSQSLAERLEEVGQGSVRNLNSLRLAGRS